MSFKNARYEGLKDDNGHAIVIVDEVDAEDRALSAPIPMMANGLYLKDKARLDNALAGHKALADFGLTVSTAVVDATEVLRAVDKYEFKASVPLIAGMTRDQVVAAFDQHVRDKAVQANVANVRGMFIYQAQTQLENALSAETDSILGQLRKPFEKAAAEYLKHSDATVYLTPGDAAMAGDLDGSTVARWHQCRLAAQTMNSIGDLVLALSPRDGALRSEEAGNSGRIPCLVADFDGADSILAIAHAEARVQRGLIADARPFGQYPTILEAGGKHGLPATGNEWLERIEGYQGLRNTAAFGLFR